LSFLIEEKSEIYNYTAKTPCYLSDLQKWKQNGT